ncbi:hypothetical protein ACFPU1_11860 [Thalassorhabdus alkalitolerans]|uniref:Uncharacterized protein n=1 Tax=Thalassorhabdus alkalitolerans TaxID=2282697 RepID=A0ABW0YP00_9BACI
MNLNFLLDPDDSAKMALSFLSNYHEPIILLSSQPLPAIFITDQTITPDLRKQ